MTCSASSRSGARIAKKRFLLTFLNAATSALRPTFSSTSRNASVSMDLDVRSTYSMPYLPESISASCSSSRARSSPSRSSCFFSLNCVAIPLILPYYCAMKRTRTAEEMQQYAIEVVSSLSPQERSATVVALSGELGAGKTTFVQGAAKALGITEQVTSPTFVLEKIYQLEGQPFDKAKGKKFERLIHIDAYRLKSAHELEILGWETLLQDPANLILIEWPERVQEAIPKDAILITFDISADKRIITLTYVEKKEN